MLLESTIKNQRNKNENECATRASMKKLFEVRIYLSKYLSGRENTCFTMEISILKRVK